MRKSVIYFLPLLLMLFFLNFTAAADESFRRVLFISSYSPSFPTFQHQMIGLRSVFDDEDIVMDFEFMDSKRFIDEEHRGNFERVISYKLKNSPEYDILITADDNALDFCLEYRDELFNNIPIVFFGVNDVEKALSLNNESLVTGIIEAVSMRETIELVFSLCGDAGEITAISDLTTSGQADLRRFYSEEENFPDYKFSDIQLGELSWSEFADYLSAIKEDKAVLLLSAYSDRNNVRKLFYESLEIINSNLNQPLFHLWYHGVGEGVLGGKLISMKEQAVSAAKLSLRILDGEDSSSMEISSEAANFYIFDYDELEKFSISRSMLPKDSMIINQPVSFYRENKAIVWLAAVIFLLLVVLLIITTFDIFRRRKIEKELRESEEKYRASFYDSKSVMLIIDPVDGNIVDVNDAAIEYYGYSYDEFIMNNIMNININIQSTEQLRENMDIALGGEKGVFTFKHRKADGSLRDVEVYARPVLLNEKKYIYSIIHDETDKNEYLFEMKNAKVQAEQALRIKNDFMANISHELRTPLNGIMGMLSLLENADFSRDEQNWYKLAVLSSGNLKVIIEALLNYAQFDTGRLQIKNEFFDIDGLVNLTAGIYRKRIWDKGLSLETEQNCRSGFFYGDETRISQIVNNLLSNSIKYSKEGVIRLKIGENDGFLTIEVADNGIGIPADKISSIFEPFKQLDDSFTKQYQGIGLGLAIVKNILNCIGGKISVDSEEGKGTVFSVEIPGVFTDDV